MSSFKREIQINSFQMVRYHSRSSLRMHTQHVLIVYHQLAARVQVTTELSGHRLRPVCRTTMDGGSFYGLGGSAHLPYITPDRENSLREMHGQLDGQSLHPYKEYPPPQIPAGSGNAWSLLDSKLQRVINLVEAQSEETKAVKEEISGLRAEIEDIKQESERLAVGVAKRSKLQTDISVSCLVIVKCTCTRHEVLLSCSFCTSCFLPDIY